jgi:hypothetical protein
MTKGVSGRIRRREHVAAARVAVACALVAWPAGAAAFCRTTTCKCTKDAPLPNGPTGLPRSTCGEPNGECPRDEHGCVTRGTPVAWRGACVGYSPNLIGTAQLSDEEWKAAFQESFHAWQLVDCGGGAHPSIQLFALRPTTCGESKYNDTGPNVNSVYFTDNGWSGPQTTENLDHVLARAKINFLSSGEIVDADIAINSARKEFTVTSGPGTVDEDLVSVLTHEVGHFLGIAHSDDPAAVMYWQYGSGAIRRTLQPDDIAAVCAAYPPGRGGECDPTPRGGLQDRCGETTTLEPGCRVAPGGRSGGLATGTLGVLGFIVLRGVAKRTRRGRR